MNNVPNGFYWYRGSLELCEPADFPEGKWRVIEVDDGTVYAFGSEMPHKISDLHGDLIASRIQEPSLI
jgi:hypothetical protein